MTEVVCAVIFRDRRLLLTQRRHDDSCHPFAWECPGGSVDGNESHHDALRREMLEELGVGVIIGDGMRAIWSGYINILDAKGPREIFLLMYPVMLAAGMDPRAVEGQGLGWFHISEVGGLRLTPGNEQAHKAIEDAYNKIYRQRRGDS